MIAKTDFKRPRDAMDGATFEELTAFLAQRAAVAPVAPKPEVPALAAQRLMVARGLDIVPASWPGIMAAMKTDTMPMRKGWILYGPTGTGKTVRARLAREFAGVEVVTARHLFDELITLPFYQASRIGSLTISSRMKGSDLIIDDLGTEPQTATIYGNVRNPMAELLEERYEVWPHIRTYMTTNLTSQEIEERYGERVVSRLSEMCGTMLLYGADRRKN